jgi:thioredoxin 1
VGAAMNAYVNSELTAPRVIALNASNFDAAIRSGVILVDFWAPWCGPCRLQTPVLDQVAGQVGDSARVAKVNVEEHPGLAERFRITGIPTLLLFKDGQLVRQFVGLQPLTTLVDALESAS